MAASTPAATVIGTAMRSRLKLVRRALPGNADFAPCSVPFVKTASMLVIAMMLGASSHCVPNCSNQVTAAPSQGRVVSARALHVADIGCACTSSQRAKAAAGDAHHPRTSSRGIVRRSKSEQAERHRRGMWVWNTRQFLDGAENLQDLITSAKTARISRLYLYLTAREFASDNAQIAQMTGVLADHGFEIWAAEGWRGYFSDVDGPGALYAAADLMVSFNEQHKPSSRFAGFVSDMEPHDGQHPTFPAHFHNGIADSRLNPSQARDRFSLMHDWVSIHEVLATKMKAAGLRYSAAVPSWITNYADEPIHVVINQQREEVVRVLLRVAQQLVVMSYNTDLVKVQARMDNFFLIANTITGIRPQVFASVETNAGLERNISYGDHPHKNARSAVLSDISRLELAMARHRSFGGIDVHDWVGWRRLRE